MATSRRSRAILRPQRARDTKISKLRKAAAVSGTLPGVPEENYRRNYGNKDAAFLLTSGGFLLTVKFLYLQWCFGSFLTVRAVSLTIGALLLTIRAFLLIVGRCVYKHLNRL